MDARATAHEAFARRDGQAAFDALSALADPTADDLDARAECAHWLGAPDVTIADYTKA